MTDVFDGTVFIFNLARHVWAYIIGGIFTFLAIILSGVEIYRHFMYNQDLRLRTHVLRILLMVPIYAMNAYLGLLNKDHMEYFTLVRDAYEAVVIYAFANFLFDYLGGQQRLLLLATLNLTPYPGACNGGSNDMYVTPEGMLTDARGKPLPQINVTVDGAQAKEANAVPGAPASTRSAPIAIPRVIVPTYTVLTTAAQVTVTAPTSATRINSELEQLAQSYQSSSASRSRKWGLFGRDRDTHKIDITGAATATSHDSPAVPEAKEPLLLADDSSSDAHPVAHSHAHAHTDLPATSMLATADADLPLSELSLATQPPTDGAQATSPSLLTLSYTPLSATVHALPITDTDKQLYHALRQHERAGRDGKREARGKKRVGASGAARAPEGHPGASDGELSLSTPSLQPTASPATGADTLSPSAPLPPGVSRKVHRHMFPVHYLYPDPVSPARFVFLAKVGILQYVPVQVVCSAMAFLFHAAGVYEAGNWHLNDAYPYLALVLNFSQMTAMYFLVWFYHDYQAPLAPCQPLWKFLSVKAVVFFTFWQSVLISLWSWLSPVPCREGDDEETAAFHSSDAPDTVAIPEPVQAGDNAATRTSTPSPSLSSSSVSARVFSLPAWARDSALLSWTAPPSYALPSFAAVARASTLEATRASALPARSEAGWAEAAFDAEFPELVSVDPTTAALLLSLPASPTTAAPSLHPTHATHVPHMPALAPTEVFATPLSVAADDLPYCGRDAWNTAQRGAALQNFLICIEMAVFAVVFSRVFGYKEFVYRERDDAEDDAQLPGHLSVLSDADDQYNQRVGYVPPTADAALPGSPSFSPSVPATTVLPRSQYRPPRPVVDDRPLLRKVATFLNPGDVLRDIQHHLNPQVLRQVMKGEEEELEEQEGEEEDENEEEVKADETIAAGDGDAMSASEGTEAPPTSSSVVVDEEQKQILE